MHAHMHTRRQYINLCSHFRCSVQVPDRREDPRRTEGSRSSDPQDIPAARGAPRPPDAQQHSSSLGTEGDRAMAEAMSRSPGNLSPGMLSSFAARRRHGHLTDPCILAVSLCIGLQCALGS